MCVCVCVYVCVFAFCFLVYPRSCHGSSGTGSFFFFFLVSASASALYSVGLVTALYTGERERRCLVTPCERVLEALHCLRVNHLCFQLVPFNNCFHKE